MKRSAKFRVASFLAHMATLNAAWSLDLPRFLLVCAGSALALQMTVRGVHAARDEEEDQEPTEEWKN